MWPLPSARRSSQFVSTINTARKRPCRFVIPIQPIHQRINGVGGFNLPEVASNSTGLEQQVFLIIASDVSSTLVNELPFVQAGETSTRGVQTGLPLLIIKDSFTTGGSQSNRRATENHVQLNEICRGLTVNISSERTKYSRS